MRLIRVDTHKKILPKNSEADHIHVYNVNYISYTL